MEDDYSLEDDRDPFKTIHSSSYPPIFSLTVSVAYNLAKLIIIISLIYYLCKFHE